MITKQLEQYRLRRNITNKVLAKMLGIHTISWYRIKRTGKFGLQFFINAQKILSDNTPSASHQKRYKPFLGRVRGWVRAVLSRDITIP